MTNRNAMLAELLREYADLLALAGANRFQVGAYERAARAVAEYPGDVATLGDRDVSAIPGVGKSIGSKILEFARHGSIASLQELRDRSAPPTVRDLAEIPGIGLRRAMQLYTELGVTDLDALREALEAGRIRELKGFGPAAEQRIRTGIGQARDRRAHMRLPEALSLAGVLADALQDSDGVRQASHAGSLRRMCDVVADIDLVAAHPRPGELLDAFAESSLCASVVRRDAHSLTFHTTRDIVADLYVVEPPRFGAALVWATGSVAHVSALAHRAASQSMDLAPTGLTRDGAPVATPAEHDVYEALGLPWIPPVLREGRDELSAADAGALPHLVQLDDLRGDLQTHSTYSDGRSTLREMVMAAVGRGYEYYAVTDHGPGLTFMRDTVGPRELARQAGEVRELNAELSGRITVLHGIEANIGPDGSLDYPDEVLAGLDLVVASMHSGLRGDRATTTRRILRAIDNPNVDVLGHPTNRRIGSRPESDIDLDAVFRAAAQRGVAVEISGSPERMDLRDEHVRTARTYGTRFAINTDAHSPRELEFLELGVATAQRAWVGPGEVVNTLPLAELLALRERRRSQA